MKKWIWLIAALGIIGIPLLIDRIGESICDGCADVALTFQSKGGKPIAWVYTTLAYPGEWDNASMQLLQAAPKPELDKLLNWRSAKADPFVDKPLTVFVPFAEHLSVLFDRSLNYSQCRQIVVVIGYQDDGRAVRMADLPDVRQTVEWTVEVP